MRALCKIHDKLRTYTRHTRDSTRLATHTHSIGVQGGVCSVQLHVHVGASAQPPFRVPRAVPRAARERLRERERQRRRGPHRYGRGASVGAQLAIIGLTSFQSSLRMSNLSR